MKIKRILSMLEDEISEENELKFKLLASSDGIGLGGNNIDDALDRKSVV